MHFTSHTRRKYCMQGSINNTGLEILGIRGTVCRSQVQHKAQNAVTGIHNEFQSAAAGEELMGHQWGKELSQVCVTVRAV